MAEKFKSDTSRKVGNPLLTAAADGFPFEQFSRNTLLMPVSQSDSSILSGDVGEPDSFLGQDAQGLTGPEFVQTRAPFVPFTQQNVPFGSHSTELLNSSASSSRGPTPSQTPPFFAVPTPPPPSQHVRANVQPPGVATCPPFSEQHPASISAVPPPFGAVPPPVPVVPPIGGGSNTYRLGQRRPVYAQPPGLSVSSLPSAPLPVGPPGSTFTSASVPLDTKTTAAFSQPPTAINRALPTSAFSPIETAPISAAHTSEPNNLVTSSVAASNIPGTIFSPSVQQSFSTNVASAPSTIFPNHIYPLSTDIRSPGHNSAFASNITIPLSSPSFSDSSFNSNIINPSEISGISSSNSVTAPSSSIQRPVISTPVSIFTPAKSQYQQNTVSNASAPASYLSTLESSSSVSTPVPLFSSNVQPVPFSSSSVNSDSPHLSRSTGLPSSSVRLFTPSAPQPSALPLSSTLFTHPSGTPHTNMAATTSEGPPPTMTPTQLPSPLQYQSPVVGDKDKSPTVLPPSFNNLAQNPGGMVYRPIYHHWFFKKEVENKVLWQPFSMVDSLALEDAFLSTDMSPETRVPTDGGRYDVVLLRRQREAVYWQERSTEVRRCSWFSKGPADSQPVPYEENISARLEEEYKEALTTNQWHRRVELPNEEAVVFHGPGVMVHFLRASTPDAWGNTPQTPTRPRVVKRGVDEYAIDEGEPAKVDHLVFIVHGIGSVCDLKFRTVQEVVDDFRHLSLQLVQSHFHGAVDRGEVSRIEILPISWHATLHGEDTGIDRKLKNITLRSIPRLRHFTNDTLLDILFYTSPVYCQTIMQTVGKEMNRLYDLFRSRNPDFEGGVSIGGHSLGSVICFDLLCHQKPLRPEPKVPEAGAEKEEDHEASGNENESSEDTVAALMPGSFKPPSSHNSLSRRVSYVIGFGGTGQPYIKYPQLNFHPQTFYAMGSPIGMFVTVRGIEKLGEDFHLPTCPGFFNVFHPFDPVAYRIETLINPDLPSVRPVLIPHHKGRKRMHLELKETMARVGADIKQRLVESVRNTWNTVYQLAMFHRSDDAALEQEVDKVLEEHLQAQSHDGQSTHSTEAEEEEVVCVGQLNQGRRVDYVLQEAPLESFNEYLFALGSHVGYWESEDTMLLILTEIYREQGIIPDNPVLQAHPSQSSSTTAIAAGPPLLPPILPVRSFSELGGTSSEAVVGMDPTAPPSNGSVGPPPMAGFMRK